MLYFPSMNRGNLPNGTPSSLIGKSSKEKFEFGETDAGGDRKWGGGIRLGGILCKGGILYKRFSLKNNYKE